MLGLFDKRRVMGGLVIIDRKSTPYSDIALPKFVTDPLYTSSQGGLNELGTGLINGDIPDYYKSIGDFNSPQFQAMLNSVKGQITQSNQELNAINGTGRSGVGVTATNNALNSVIPQLTYQDYLRAIQGRGALLDTGINVKSGVRGAAQQQGSNESNFNQTIFEDQVGLASLMDNWKKQDAQARGQQISNIVSAVGGAGVGAITGFATGGPVGAAVGGVSGGIKGYNGDPTGGLSSLFSSLSNTSGSKPSASYGISDQGLGSFSSLSSLSGSVA